MTPHSVSICARGADNFPSLEKVWLLPAVLRTSNTSGCTGGASLKLQSRDYIALGLGTGHTARAAAPCSVSAQTGILRCQGPSQTGLALRALQCFGLPVIPMSELHIYGDLHRLSQRLP